MAIILTDLKLRQLEVDNIADVTGVTPAVSPSGYDIGWRAHVQSAVATDNDRYFVVVIDDTTQQHKWLELLTTVNSVLKPDQRFTVGSAAYDLLNPGTSTFLTAQTGITGAAAGTGTTLGAASTTSRRLVEVQPGLYPEALTAVSFVGVRGMGSAPSDVIINPAAGIAYDITAVANDVFEVENLTLAGPVDIAASGAGTSRVIFRDVIFDGVTANAVSFDAAAAAGHTLEIVLERCSGTLGSFATTGAGSIQVHIRGAATPAPSADTNAVSGWLAAPASMSFDADTTNILFVDDDAVVRNTAGGILFLCPATNSGAYLFELSQCRLSTQSSTSDLVRFTAAPSNAFIVIDRIRLDLAPLSLVNDQTASGNVQVQINEYTILSTANVNAAARPVIGVTGGASLSTFAADRIASQRKYGTFAVPAAGAFGTTYYLTNAPNVGGVDFDFSKDTHTFIADYGAAYAIDPNTGSIAFRFAIFELPDPMSFEDGRVFSFKNIGNPASTAPNLHGPVAIALPAAGATLVDYMDSRPAVSTVITSAAYVILAPGDTVKLMVDRNGTTPGQWRQVP